MDGIMAYENARIAALLTYTMADRLENREAQKAGRSNEKTVRLFAYPKMARRAYIAGIGSV